MRAIELPVRWWLRLALSATLGVTAMGALACGTPTPTRPPGSPTFASPAQPTQSVVQPTAGGLAAPTSLLPTATKFAIAAASPTSAAAIPTPLPKPAVLPTLKPAAPSGRIAYSVVAGAAPQLHSIWVANVDGSGAHQILTHAEWPSLSPDGSRIAYFGRPEGGSEGLYIANSDGGNRVLVVIAPGICCVKWSRDGNWIVYANSNRPAQPGGPISMVKIDSVFKTIVSLGVTGNGPAFSPDGKQVVYSGCLPNTSTCGLHVVSTGGGAARLLTSDNGGNAAWSPQGDKIVYQTTDAVGHLQVFIVNPDGSGKKQLTAGKSNDGQPAWSRDGGSIFWRSDQNGTAWAIYAMNANGANPRKILDNVPPDQDLWGWESLSVGP